MCALFLKEKIMHTPVITKKKNYFLKYLDIIK